MHIFEKSSLKKLYIPTPYSHKGENGKVMIIAGSKLFHAASLWPLETAYKIVDMVFYSSVSENNEIVKKIKELWRNGIVVPRNKIEGYINEADAILIGPGLPREEGEEKGDDDTKVLTERLLTKYPQKKWVIDGGSLQTISPELLPKNCIITPHHQEFELLKLKIKNEKLKNEIKNAKIEDQVRLFAQNYSCIVLLKGPADIICSLKSCEIIVGGNPGMTKGGTGDVLAGLTVALYAQNDDSYLVAKAASYINKKAGENLFVKVGPYFNSSDLVEEIPKVLKELLF